MMIDKHHEIFLKSDTVEEENLIDGQIAVLLFLSNTNRCILISKKREKERQWGAQRNIDAIAPVIRMDLFSGYESSVSFIQ